MLGGERDPGRAPRAGCAWPDDEPVYGSGADRLGVQNWAATRGFRFVAGDSALPKPSDEALGLREDALLRSSLVTARLVVRADNATFALAERATESAVVVASARDESGELWGSRFRSGDGVAGHVLITGRPLLVDDTRHAPVFRRIGSHPVRSIAAVPVEADGRTLGVLSFTSSRPRRFARAQTELIQAVAAQFATVVARAAHAAYLDQLRGLAHDLNTPLNALRGFLHLALERETPLPAPQRELLDLAAVAADQLVRIVGDMHDSMYLSNGRLNLRLSQVDPVLLVRDMVAGCVPLAEEGGLQLMCAAHADVPAISADRRRVERILGNLIQNAIRYSPSGSTVRIGVQRDGTSGVRITVEDEGPGVNEEEIGRLFSPCYRGKSSAVRATDGHGLGLSIASALAAAHRGRLHVENRATGGARFTLVLPIDLESTDRPH